MPLQSKTTFARCRCKMMIAMMMKMMKELPLLFRRSSFIVHRSSVRYRGGVFIEGASLSRGVMIILNRAYDLTNTTENIPKAKRNESINQN